ncbi:MAG: VWA domain-containing protein [Opitutales bacterium]
MVESLQIRWDTLTAWLERIDWAQLSWLYPAWFLALLIPVLALLIKGRTGPHLALTFSSSHLLSGIAQRSRQSLGGLWPYLRIIGFILLVAALARPVVPRGQLPEEYEGIDIMLVLDYSGSMEERDFYWQGEAVSRKEALAKVVSQFLEDRVSDRFGIVSFSTVPNLVSPLTTDYDWIRACMINLEAEGGTAVGEGIVMAVKYLKEQADRQKVMILVSDGLNNRGYPPVEAARLARQDNIRIHTIRIFPDPLDPDEVRDDLMQQISENSLGQFYQANDTAMLQSIYEQIDTLEKSRLEQKRYQDNEELYAVVLWPGLLLILLEGLLRPVVRRRLP